MTGQSTTFQARRQRLLSTLDTHAIVLIDSTGTAPNPALADRNLCYLTGYAGCEAVLLLTPGGVMVEHNETRGGPELALGRRVHEILFVREQEVHQTFMDGAQAPLEAIRDQSGVERVYSLAQLDPILSRALMDASQLWVNVPGAPPLDRPPSPHLTYINRLRERFCWVPISNIASRIHDLRFVKDAAEIAAQRQAFAAQTEVFETIMRTLKPGDNESLGQAVFEYEVGNRGKRYRSMAAENYEAGIVVASGSNSLVPHYMANSRDIANGDLVLIDACVSYDGYYADITRTFPANGRFTPRQREIYSIVLEAHYAAIDTLKPGSTILEAHRAIYETFRRYGVAEYGYGNCGHSIGLTIHDPHGRFRDDREQPLEPGVVLAIEPFLMMAPDGFGIRIEDGVIITANGHELMPGPAREIDAVEALCRR